MAPEPVWRKIAVVPVILNERYGLFSSIEKWHALISSWSGPVDCSCRLRLT
jgi:hypothetical protein